MDEAKLKRTDHGVVVEGDGWFVVNAAEARWKKNAQFGSAVLFEGDVKFPQYGINIHVIEPGRANCYYHRENQQENFLVLSGECILLIEEQERPLKAWDFVHCPPGTNHVFVGAGQGPCAILMVGARQGEETVTYPRSELALSHGAGVEEETDDPRVAYADVPKSEPVKSDFFE